MSEEKRLLAALGELGGVDKLLGPEPTLNPAGDPFGDVIDRLASPVAPPRPDTFGAKRMMHAARYSEQKPEPAAPAAPRSAGGSHDARVAALQKQLREMGADDFAALSVAMQALGDEVDLSDVDESWDDFFPEAA